MRASNLPDRQTSLIALSEETESTVRVAHSAARSARHANRVEFSICVNLVGHGNVENSESSDK